MRSHTAGILKALKELPELSSIGSGDKGEESKRTEREVRKEWHSERGREAEEEEKEESDCLSDLVGKLEADALENEEELKCDQLGEERKSDREVISDDEGEE